MAETRVWPVAVATTVRKTDSGGGGQGAGKATVLTVGRHGSSGSRNYTSYCKFTLDWTNVGRIISAVLTLTTSDNFPSTSSPRVIVRGLTSAFTEGSHSGFSSSDYTTPSIAATPVVVKAPMALAVDDVTDIDITDIVKGRWAPASAGGSGTLAQANARNHGLALQGDTTATHWWEGHSDDATTPGFRPYITLTFERGPTIPNAPSNLSPDGSVVSIDAFEADFVDIRDTDTLNTTQVQVYASGAVKAGTAATNDQVAVAAHGYAVGREVWFHSLTGGAGLSAGQPYYVKTVVDSGHFKVSATPTGPVVDITTAYTALTVASPYWSISKEASDTEVTTDHSFVLPTGLHIPTRTAFDWRVRQRDQEGQWSAWSSMTSITVTNTDPNAPTELSPDADGIPAADDLDTLYGAVFRGAFTDPDAEDTLLAFQLQLSNLSSPSDPNWDDASMLMWDSGKQYVASGATAWESPYGGKSLTAGTWYWRARQWDQSGGLSDWSYARIVLLNDFNADPGSQSEVQFNPHAPWRIRIREMAYNSIASITGAITGNATTDLFTAAKNHGLKAGRRVRFSAITGGTGLFTDRTYYVIASGLTATAFKLSESDGGAAVDFSTNVTAATLTAVTTRGPGNTVGLIENAKSVGAAKVHNSPGEAHFTLPVDHPQISVIEPKQVHYGIDFYTGDGWRENYAGLVWDADATEDEVVFSCLDYLALLDSQYDRRFYPNEPDRDYTKGGSKYSNVSLRTIVIDQLTRAKNIANSPVGFIQITSVAAMDERVTLWSTMQPTLSFVAGLLDSHRQGTGKRTRISVKRLSASAYGIYVEDDPGQTRDNLRLRYGEIVNGYRVIIFGDNWASVVHGIGRTREGVRVLYKTASAPGVEPTVWGNIERAIMLDGVSDPNDLTRRLKQEAIKAGKFGQAMAIAIRTGLLKPFDGYDIGDALPVAIKHGAIDTSKFGSGYYNIWAVAWEAQDNGSQNVILTLLPREDTVAAAQDLIDGSVISPQAEWQIIPSGVPDPTVHTAGKVLSQSRGIVYTRNDGIQALRQITGTA